MFGSIMRFRRRFDGEEDFACGIDSIGKRVVLIGLVLLLV